MFEELKKTAAGAAILKDWVGAGLEPVSGELANQRAKVCTACPMNIHGSWWATATGVVASAIRTQLAFKDSADVWVEDEYKLGTCNICICNLPLKIWCPLDHIKAHTTEEQVAMFPTPCWIKSELTK